MKRTMTTYGKKGVIDIKGNAQETVLYLRDKPIQYSWYAEIGSTWRYHIGQGLTKQAVFLHKGMEKLLKEGIQHEGDFLAITEYFNKFLKYGTYEYGYYELPKGLHTTAIPQEETYEYYDSYGGCVELSPTQNFIEEDMVQRYKEQILRNRRPVMVLLHVENSYMFYILDGHHKFLAYNKAGIPPHAVIITKLEKVYPSIDAGIALARRMNCAKQAYFDQMERGKSNLNYYESLKLNLEKGFRRIEN